MKFICAHCGEEANKPAGQVNRSLKRNAALYCTRICFGLSRRKHKTADQLKEEKRLYDKQYRRKNLAMIKARKAAFFKRTYDPTKAAEHRKGRMAAHAEYCRRPEYKAWKREYDRKHRAKRCYGEFWESHILLVDLENAVNSRMTRYEIYKANDTINKTLRRKRDYEKSVRQEP